jgi:MerR family mercuric resistance operon transcriptional regulator
VQGYTIGKLAGATGVHIETIRYYQRVGLLPVPPRGDGAARRYGPDAVERLSLIRSARRLTFSLAEVAALLAVTADAQGCAEARAITAARRDEVEREVAKLQAVSRELAELVALCDNARGSACPLLRQLGRAAPGGP